jgi:hypothetical protein
MDQATPVVRHLARLLLNLEASPAEPAEGEAHAVLSAVAKLRGHLAKLVGLVGFQALLARALALAKSEVRWLETVRITADTSLEGLSESARQQSAEAVAAGSAALLAQLIGLLVSFIGEALTLRLVGEVWPDLQDQDLGAKEIRHE